eukprot:CAMPEP_0119393692 /NCGR_PEP_ID=MMETSP1334-20130426/126266_1 /TAXON_ID=127549 /ORGANISM="Calcidiscus leptoporus, Strain RCC1130" /LENGTH=142 /DNA_ID=CAMNT_0007416803 /DNA_START=397 /DNA_END=821 /DNA_ORIENTATION=+
MLPTAPQPSSTPRVASAWARRLWVATAPSLPLGCGSSGWRRVLQKKRLRPLHGRLQHGLRCWRLHWQGEVRAAARSVGHELNGVATALCEPGAVAVQRRDGDVAAAGAPLAHGDAPAEHLAFLGELVGEVHRPLGVALAPRP